ncbi:MAG TPA: flavin reductase family protein [Glycomyces sp.]|nr:flavin reductase family protein [Glycomyces sp.]
MHVEVGLKVLYFGTPVVLVSTRNEDGSANLAPISSAWWLDRSAMIGFANAAQSAANLRREGECVLNLVPSTLADAVDRLAPLTGAPQVHERKAAKGYRYEKDKFGAAGLTEQPSRLVGPPRVRECPIQLECRLDRAHLFGEDDSATAFEVAAVAAHVDEELLVPGTEYVDPVGWDPMIMKFCEYFGHGRPLRRSTLAAFWRMPHERLRDSLPGPA